MIKKKKLKKLYLTSPDSKKSIPDFINIKTLPACISTNNYINKNLDLLKSELPLVVSADIQTGGKGRDGRKWLPVGDGGIYISYLLKIKNIESLSFLSLAAGTAIAEAITTVTGLNVQLKWPNDIEFSGSKVGGVLIENKLFSNNMLTVIGIGLNVNATRNQLADEILETATSLSIISGKKTSIKELILKISEYLLYLIEAMEDKMYESILKRYLSYLKHKTGDEISFHNSGKTIRGTFIKINEKGGLVLKHINGREESFFSGEIFPIL